MKLKTNQVGQLQVLQNDMPTDLPFVAGQRVHYPPSGDGTVLAIMPTRCHVEWIAPSQVHGAEGPHPRDILIAALTLSSLTLTLVRHCGAPTGGV